MSFTDLERGVQRSGNPTMSLESMRSLLSRLNDPHLGRGTVHVTGSKGKSSTAAMIQSILRRDVVVITPISLERTAILGPTPEAIATDKAGLVKSGTTCVMAAQRSDAAADVIRARCAEVGAELIDVAALYTTTPGERFAFGQS